MTDRLAVALAVVAMSAMFAVGVASGIAIDHRLLHRPAAEQVYRGEPGGHRDRPGPPDRPMRTPGRPPAPNGMGVGPERAFDAFARDLDLTAAQRAAADSILREEFETVTALREGVWSRMRAIMDDARQRVDSLLTPEQRERYHELLESQDRRFRSRDRGRGPGPMDMRRHGT